MSFNKICCWYVVSLLKGESEGEGENKEWGREETLFLSNLTWARTFCALQIPDFEKNNLFSSLSIVLCTSQCKPRPPDPRDIAGDVTFLQCYISTFTPALGGIWTVTIPALRAPVSKARSALPSRGVWGHAPRENFEILYSQRRIFLHSEALNGKYETCWKHGNLSLYSNKRGW